MLLIASKLVKACPFGDTLNDTIIALAELGFEFLSIWSSALGQWVKDMISTINWRYLVINLMSSKVSLV